MRFAWTSKTRTCAQDLIGSVPPPRRYPQFCPGIDLVVFASAGRADCSPRRLPCPSTPLQSFTTAASRPDPLDRDGPRQGAPRIEFALHDGGPGARCRSRVHRTCTYAPRNPDLSDLRPPVAPVGAAYAEGCRSRRKPLAIGRSRVEADHDAGGIGRVRCFIRTVYASPGVEALESELRTRHGPIVPRPAQRLTRQDRMDGTAPMSVPRSHP